MRFADRTEERTALNARVQNAITSAGAKNALSVLSDFGLAVAGSKCVVARDIGVLQSLVKSDNVLYVTYHSQVRSGSRLPEDNKWDRGRDAAESTVNPFFYKDISFAGLSLNGVGVRAYGDYHITLRENLIAHRTSVFEENPFNFCQKQRITAGQEAPLGYRAVWKERNLLAMAKLHSHISSGTKPDEYADILVTQGTHTGDGEFIEAHIYGPIHRQAIEKVIGRRPKGGPDLPIWRSVVKELRRLGAAVEEYV
ncbi:MAG TPA: hypothetical protein VHL98_11110 [Microvirga sp.]|nr:hypothetical protein [Microvirga sp.]